MIFGGIGSFFKNKMYAAESFFNRDFNGDNMIGRPTSGKRRGAPITPWLAHQERMSGSDLNGDGRIGAGRSGYKYGMPPYMSPYNHHANSFYAGWMSAMFRGWGPYA